MMDATQLSAIRADLAALQRMIDHGYEPQLTVAVEHGTALLDEVDRLSEGWTQSDEAFDSFLDDFALKCQEWDGDLTPEAVLEYAEKQRSEVERLHTALAAAGDFMDPGTRRLWLAALRTDPEEK